MSCSNTPVSALLTRYAGTSSGWHFSAIQVLAHALTKEARHHFTESRAATENGRELIETTRQRIATDPTLSATRRTKLLEAADRALDYLDEGGEVAPRWWYALTRLPAVATEAATVRDTLLRQAATDSGKSYAEMRRAWNKAIRDTPPTGRGRRAPSGTKGGLPQDPATRHALDQLNLGGGAATSAAWRPLSGTSHIHSLHVSPETGHVTIILRSDTSQALTYAAPESDIAAILGDPNPTAFTAARVRTNHWSLEHTNPTTHCPRCGKFETPAAPCKCPTVTQDHEHAPDTLRLYTTESGPVATNPVTDIRENLTAYSNSQAPIYMPIVDPAGNHVGEVHGIAQISRKKWGAPPQVDGNPYCTACQDRHCHHVTDALNRLQVTLVAPSSSHTISPPDLPEPPTPSTLSPISDETPVDISTIMATSRRRRNKATNLIPVTFDPVGGPGSHRRFGLEIEVDAPHGLDEEDTAYWVNTVTRALHAAGLTDQPRPWDYHESKGNYSQQLKGGWRAVLDASCTLEIVTPILKDTPDTWRTVHEAVAILNDHKATTTRRTGLHVHVSTPDFSPDGSHANNLITFVRHNEDLLVRIATDPERGTHRGGLYCGPNSIFSQGQHRIGAVPLAQPGRDVMVNLDHLTGHPDSRVEWRLWDGSLDAGVIQARTSVSLAATDLAARGWSPSTPGALLGENYLSNNPAIGEHAINAVQALTEDLFSSAKDKTRLAQLAGATPWQIPTDWDPGA